MIGETLSRYRVLERLGAGGMGEVFRAEEEDDWLGTGIMETVRVGADEPFTRYYVACAWAALGERERALDALERAAARRAFTVERARIEPDLESLRGEPRFRALTGGGPGG